MEKRKDVKIKPEHWEKLSYLAIKERLSLQTVIDGILEAAIKVMEESNVEKS
jgi:hypothetical protein